MGLVAFEDVFLQAASIRIVTNPIAALRGRVLINRATPLNLDGHLSRSIGANIAPSCGAHPSRHAMTLR